MQNNVMRHVKTIKVFLLVSFLILTLRCTDLEENYNGNLTTNQVANNSTSVNSLLLNLQNSVRSSFEEPFGQVIALSEITTDELMAPTRGSNWFDNGIWQQLHQHRWNSNHNLISECFNNLNGIVFAATDLLRYKPSPEQEAVARFYRAWAMFWLLDFFDQVPYREPGESVLEQARVRKGIEAFVYIVNEINSIFDKLPDNLPTSPNKNAAKVLLMKCYLNKAVYLNRESPSFEISDMNKVIKLADEIINTGKYSFTNNYFDNFSPDNTTIGYENIWTEENMAGVGNNQRLWLLMILPLHYNSTPFGFNGWATTPTLYGKFEEGDKRRGQAYHTEDSPPNPGNRINIGLLAGQQYDLYTDEPLKEGSNRPLIFTMEVKNQETGENLESTGIRPQKYAWDYHNMSTRTLDNDWVYFRLSDVLLMKAEAILRGGAATAAGTYGTTALEIVNSIRVHPSRNASALTSVNLDLLLDERAREFWLECWRRQDLIRFKKFLEPFYEKDQSDPKYLLFPIPSQQMNVNNKFLTQNPGYN